MPCSFLLRYGLPHSEDVWQPKPQQVGFKVAFTSDLITLDSGAWCNEDVVAWGQRPVHNHARASFMPWRIFLPKLGDCFDHVERSLLEFYTMG